MNTEDAYFKTLNEIILLSELYTALSEEQVVTIIETVNYWLSQLPPDVIDRYKVFLRNSIQQEKTRGAYARASALDDHATALGLDEES